MDFPSLPAARLNRDDVVRYLSALKARGYEVFRHPTHENFLVLMLDEVHRLNFSIGDNTCQLQGEKYGHPFAIADVTSMLELERAANGIARQVLGSRWGLPPSRARVSEATPATNLATISTLVDSASIEAVFDPYLDNKSLAALIDILSFGAGSVANGVRVLSTARTTTGQIPRLTKAGFDAWLVQLKINGELRLMQPSEHRRFLLLSGGTALLLGQSLNSLHKNEAVRLEPDGADRSFFDQVWAQATPLV